MSVWLGLEVTSLGGLEEVDAVVVLFPEVVNPPNEGIGFGRRGESGFAGGRGASCREERGRRDLEGRRDAGRGEKLFVNKELESGTPTGTGSDWVGKRVNFWVGYQVIVRMGALGMGTPTPEDGKVGRDEKLGMLDV